MAELSSQSPACHQCLSQEPFLVAQSRQGLPNPSGKAPVPPHTGAFPNSSSLEQLAQGSELFQGIGTLPSLVSPLPSVPGR